MAAVLASGQAPAQSSLGGAALAAPAVGAEWAGSDVTVGLRRGGASWHRAVLRRGRGGCVVDGIPVTSVFRTIFDLAAVLTRRQLERAMNEAEVRGLTDRRLAAASAGALSGASGNGDAESAARRGRGPAGSPATTSRRRSWRSSTRTGCRGRGSTPTWRCAGGSSRSTASGSAQRLIVELDSRGVHGTAQALRDGPPARPDPRSPRAGGSMRVTWRQLRDEPRRRSSLASILSERLTSQEVANGWLVAYP